MTQESSSQPKKDARAKIWWGMTGTWLLLLLSLMFIGLNAAFLLQLIGILAPEGGPYFGQLSEESPLQAFIIYLLLIFIFSFFVCLLSGWRTRKIAPTITISMGANSIGCLSVFFLPVVLALIVGGEASSNFFIFIANGSPAFIAFFQLAVGIVGGILGGLIGRLIGSRSPHRQRHPEDAAQPES